MKSAFNNKSFRLLFLFLGLMALAPASYGQEEGPAAPCRAFERLLLEAENAVARNDFGLAIKKYNAAKVCNPAAGLEINGRILNAFARIDEQRLQAERNAQKARRAEREALFQAQLAQQKEREALEAREQAEENELFAKEQETEARRYLSEIYFREGQRAAGEKAWDKALVNYYRAYENDKTNEAYLRLCYQAADSVLPEYLTLRRANPIWDLQFSPDNRYLVSASSGNLQFHNLREHRNDFVLRSNWTAERFYFSEPEDSIVATLSQYYGTIRFWRLGKQEEIDEYRKELYINELFFDNQDQVFGYTNSQGDLLFGELAGDSLLSWIQQNAPGEIGLDYLPGKKLVAATYPENQSNSVKIIDISEIHQKKVKFVNSFGSEIQEARFHPSGKWIATNSLDNTIRIFDLNTGQELEVFREFQGQAGELHFSKDGNYFLYAVNDIPNRSSRIVLYSSGREQARYRKKAEIRVGSGQVHSLAISPDGKWCAAVIGLKTIKLWPVEFQAPGRRLETLQSLIDYGISFTVDKNGAYSTRNDSVWVEKLFQAAKGRKISWLPDGGHQLLDIYNQNLSIVQDGRYFDALTTAVVNDDKEKAEALIRQGADPLHRNEQGVNALLFAAHLNYQGLFRFLAQGIPPEQLEEEFLWSVNNGTLNILDFFAANGVANINCQNENGETALHLACFNNDTTVVKLLLYYGANPNIQNQEGYTPFLTALLRGNYLVARQLAGLVGQVDIRDNQKLTELMIAARNDYLDIVQILLDKGADINARNNQGWTPLHFATHNGNNAVVNLLLSHGADINARDNIQQTPLHLAARQDSLSVLRLLLDTGADVSSRDDLLATPLIYAIASDKKANVEALLSYGADPNVTFKGGFTALLQARSLKQPDIYDLLLQKGAVSSKWVMQDTLHLSGEGTNVTANKTARVSFIIYPQDSLYRAIGQYDGVNLFGSFDVEGREIDCPGEELCLQFKGLILNGDGKDSFPKGTSTAYVMSLVVSPGGATGAYHIGEILNSASDYEQYGILELKAAPVRK